MYVNDNHFDSCMEKLFRAIKEVGKDLKSLVNTQDVLDGNDKLLDNGEWVNHCGFLLSQYAHKFSGVVSQRLCIQTHCSGY
ncbi:MAG: hypothetical protein EZS26_002384 [Candidatus Ordinivivax streblomastigis]|uniref:Uncharacterized protein n=1 Tax=Candidatus Ordinivivax streblomastigis TaxID=2540710 RepID=A0A5M8NZF0_9BACT|nr:MAG: hypothetical protein EZS26_002384 [Candidatus Ordinivivax streblomastigis]